MADDSKNKDLERRLAIQQELQKIERDSLDISSQMVDSLKEVLGIQSKRTTFESNLISSNKEINKLILAQKGGMNDISDIQKQVKKNSDVLVKSKKIENSLSHSIGKEGRKSVGYAKSTLTNIQKLNKEHDDLLSAAEKGAKIDESRLGDIEDELATREATLQTQIAGLSTLQKQLLFAAQNKKELEKQNKLREDELAKLIKIDKQLGVFSGVLKGLSKIPIIGDAVDLEKILKSSREETEKTGSGLKGFGAGLKTMGGQLKENLLNPVNLASGAMILLGKALLDSDKAAGELAKNLGVSYKESLGLSQEANRAALASGDLLINQKEVLLAQQKLNTEFGTSVKFSGEIAAEFASIQKRTNLSDKAMGFFARTSMKAGGSIKDTLKDVHATVLEQNKQNKVSFSVKEIQEAIANTSSRTQLIFKGNVKELGKAVVQAKMLGVSMEQLNSIAGSLLDFEGSIAAELEAELLTGKQLNLERARAAALSNDMVTLAQELKKQNIDAASFGAMNRIQQEATAKALGMSAEEMSEMLINQQKLSTLQNAFGTDVGSISDAQKKYNELRKQGLSAEEAGKDIADQSLKNQLESTSQAEKMEAVLGRIQTLFVSIAEPILAIIDPLTTILVAILEPISTVIGYILDGIKALGPALIPIIALTGTYFAITKAAAIMSVIKGAWGALGPLPVVGPALATAAVLGGIGFINSQKKEMKDGVIGPGGEMIVSGPKGSIQLDKDDSVIAGTNLGGGGSGNMNMIRRELARQNQILQKILDKDTNVYMDGNKVGTQLALSNPRMQ